MDNADAERKAEALVEVVMLDCDEYAKNPAAVRSAERRRLVKRLQDALELSPSLAETEPLRRLMVLLHVLAGLSCADESLNSESQFHYQEAIRLVEESEPHLWPEYYSIGLAYKGVGRFEDSLRAFDMAVSLADSETSGSLVPTNEQIAMLWQSLADLHMALGNWDEYIECMDYMLLYAPDNYAAQILLAFACVNTGRFGRAIGLCRWALTGEHALRYIFLQYLAMASVHEGDLKLASEAYEKLLEAAKDKDPDTRLWYARMSGYLDGLIDSGTDQRVWNRGEVGVRFLDLSLTGHSSKEPTVSEAVEKILEESRKSATEASQEMLRLDQKVTKYLTMKEDMDRDAVRARLMRDFGEFWKTLRSETREALVNADWHLSQGRSGDGEDYSAPAGMYQKAVELEVAKRIIEPFKRFLLAKRLQTWSIGSKPCEVQYLTTQSLTKLNQLFLDWRRTLSQARPDRVEGLQSLADAYHDTTVHLGKLTDAQRHLITTELVELLHWMPPLTRGAKHETVVDYSRAQELRRRLFGTLPSPGLFLKLIQLFP